MKKLTMQIDNAMSNVSHDIASKLAPIDEYQADLSKVQKLAMKKFHSAKTQDNIRDDIEKLNDDDYTTSNGYKTACSDYDALASELA